MFTDIIALNKARNAIIIHLFDPVSSNYSQKISFKPSDCEKITNVAVGRGADTLRLFVTCVEAFGKTVLQMYDRNLNGEISERKRNLGEAVTQEIKDEGKKIYNEMMGDNHMVFKSGNIKTLNFIQVPAKLQLTSGS